MRRRINLGLKISIIKNYKTFCFQEYKIINWKTSVPFRRIFQVTPLNNFSRYSRNSFRRNSWKLPKQILAEISKKILKAYLKETLERESEDSLEKFEVEKKDWRILERFSNGISGEISGIISKGNFDDTFPESPKIVFRNLLFLFFFLEMSQRIPNFC